MANVNNFNLQFLSDYENLLKFSKKHIREKRLMIDDNDLVNDAFIKFHDTGEEYNIIKIKSFITGIAFNQLTHQSANVSPEFKVHSEEKFFYCKKCDELKPAAGFYLKNVSGITKPQHLCKECFKKQSIKYYEENKEKCIKSNRDYKVKNRKKIKLVKKVYYKKNSSKKACVVRVKTKKSPVRITLHIVRKRKIITIQEKRKMEREKMRKWRLKRKRVASTTQLK